MADSALRTKLVSLGELDALQTFCIQRLNDLRAEREQQGLLGKLKKYERIAASDFQHRTTTVLSEQSIFDRSNQSLQIVRSVIRFLKARMAKDLFGSVPWFAARPEGPLSDVVASEIQKHSGWKLTQAQYKVIAKQALEVALDLGWVALKTTWRREVDISESFENILFDPTGNNGLPPDVDGGAPEDPETEGGAPDAPDEPEDPEAPAPTKPKGGPVVDPAGNYIHDDAETQQAPVMVPHPDTGEPTQPLDDETGEPMTQEVFAQAPHLTPPSEANGLKFKPHLITNQVVLFDGLDVQPCDGRDVLWPVNAPEVNLEHCDCITHTVGMTKEAMRERYNPDGSDAEFEAILDSLGESGSSNPKNHQDGPKAEVSETQAINNDEQNPTWKVTELYIRRVLKGNKAPSRMLFVLLEEAQKILYCEYLGVLSPLSECPIHVVAVNKVPGRAYGRGLYEIYEMPAEIADRLINSVLWRNAMNADPVKIWNPTLTTEGADANLVFEPGKTITAKNPQTKKEDILSLVEIPDLDERTWTMLELFMQLIQVESGVTNANQGDMSDLPSNNTATGVNSLLESSSVLHFDVLEDLRDGITPQLRYAIQLIYFRQDTDETCEYLEGDAASVMSLKSAQQIAKLPMHVEILLTRSKRQEMRDAALAAIPHGWNFWQALRSDPVAAQHMLPMYLQIFRALEIENPESFFPTVAQIQQMVDQMQQAQAQGQPGQPGAPQQALGGSAAGPVAQPSDPGQGSTSEPEAQTPDAVGSEVLPNNVTRQAA